MNNYTNYTNYTVPILKPYMNYHINFGVMIFT